MLDLLTGTPSDNGLMELVKAVAVWLAIPLVIAAVFSQFSAAVADAIGASGNLVELSEHKINTRLSYTVICLLALGLTWSADTMQILTLASKAFALYYMIQAVIAFVVADQVAKRALFALVAMAMGFVVFFAVPVG